MTDRIKPALTAEEWRGRIIPPDHPFPRYGEANYPDADGMPYIFYGEFGVSAEGYFCGVNPAQAIALANAALPDDDKRKLRREHIAALRNATVRDVIGDEDREQTNTLRNLADALDSYLPRRTE